MGAKNLTDPRGRQRRARRERRGAPEGVGPGEWAPLESPRAGPGVGALRLR